MSMAQHLELDAALYILQEQHQDTWKFVDLPRLLENLCLVCPQVWLRLGSL